MRSMVKLGGALCLSVAMTACATKTRPYNLLDAGARPHIQQMDSVLISKQDDISADVKASKLSLFVQGHFAPIIFDLAVTGFRTHKAHTLMKPIRAKLDDYDYAQEIKTAFKDAINQTDLSDNSDENEFKLIRQELPGFRAAYVQQSEADAVMFIDVKFSFAPKFDILYLSSYAMIFPNNEALSAYKEDPDTDDIFEFEDNIYRNQFIAVIRADTKEGSSKSENAAVWAEMSEEELKGLLQHAALKLADHITDDLTTDDFYETPPEAEDVSKEMVEGATEDAIDPAAEPTAEPVSGEVKDITL